MSLWKLIAFVCVSFVIVEAKWFHHQKREINSSVCSPAYNNTNKIQCYCTKSTHESHFVKSADCYPTVEGVAYDDESWDSFNELKDATKLTLTNTRGILMKYIPTKAFKITRKLIKLDVKYGNINTIEGFAFANLTAVKEIVLRDNQINILKENAFAHHSNLKSINLDTNNIVEINRDVFIDLPLLEKLYLTNNKITTIHDRAFIHLSNLKELEIDRNNIFSLNSESFSGLKNLDKLDLSSNSLEVIGDNTFLPLIRLRILNLDANKIQMIDERGFRGLSNLQALSLAHNALTVIENVKIFDGLNSLTSLSLKANPLRELKKEVIGPVLQNFYGQSSSLDIEDIKFPCDCRLDWFIGLMNKTKNGHMKQSLENLKCVPDPELRERYNNTAPVFEDEHEETEKGVGDGVQTVDYEFYDDTQLDGKLFYTDVRYLLNCTENVSNEITTVLPTTAVIKAGSKPTQVTVITTTKATASSIVTTAKSVQVTNQRDLSIEDSVKIEHNQVSELKDAPENQERKVSKTNTFTTTRLPTVSAKPIENKYDEHRMASDEAKPDGIKAHRSIQDEIKEPNFNSEGNKNIICVSMLLTIVFLIYFN